MSWTTISTFVHYLKMTVLRKSCKVICTAKGDFIFPLSYVAHNIQPENFLCFSAQIPLAKYNRPDLIISPKNSYSILNIFQFVNESCVSEYVPYFKCILIRYISYWRKLDRYFLYRFIQADPKWHMVKTVHQGFVWTATKDTQALPKQLRGAGRFRSVRL